MDHREKNSKNEDIRRVWTTAGGFTNKPCTPNKAAEKTSCIVPERSGNRREAVFREKEERPFSGLQQTHEATSTP